MCSQLLTRQECILLLNTCTYQLLTGVFVSFVCIWSWNIQHDCTNLIELRTLPKKIANGENVILSNVIKNYFRASARIGLALSWEGHNFIEEKLIKPLQKFVSKEKKVIFRTIFHLCSDGRFFPFFVSLSLTTVKELSVWKKTFVYFFPKKV